jgi:hypothetical protein
LVKSIKSNEEVGVSGNNDGLATLVEGNCDNATLDAIDSNLVRIVDMEGSIIRRFVTTNEIDRVAIKLRLQIRGLGILLVLMLE